MRLTGFPVVVPGQLSENGSEKVSLIRPLSLTMIMGAGIQQHSLGQRVAQLCLNPISMLTKQVAEDESESKRAVASNTLMASTRLIQIVESFQQNGRCSGGNPEPTGQNTSTESLLMCPTVQTADSSPAVADHSYSALDTSPNIESTPPETIESAGSSGQCSDQPRTAEDGRMNANINASGMQIQQIGTDNMAGMRTCSGKRILDTGDFGLPMMMNASDAEPGIMWPEKDSCSDTALLDLSVDDEQGAYSETGTDVGEETLQDELSELIGYEWLKHLTGTDETTEIRVPDDEVGVDQSLASILPGVLVATEPFSSSLVSIVNDEELFDEQQMSLFPALDTDLSIEDIRLIPSEGSPFNTGTEELLTSPVATSPGSVISFSEKSQESEPVLYDDTGSEVSMGESTTAPDDDKTSNAQLLSEPRIEHMLQATGELPSFYRSPEFPAMLANITEMGGEDISGAKVRKRRRPKNYEIEGVSKSKNQKKDHPDKYIPGFLFEQLYLPDKQRIIHWEIEERGIYRMDSSVLDTLGPTLGRKKE